MFVYSLSAEHKTWISINGTGLSYRSCACAFARMLAEPSPTSNCHMSLIFCCYVIFGSGGLWAACSPVSRLRRHFLWLWVKLFQTETPIIMFHLKRRYEQGLTNDLRAGFMVSG